MSSHHRCCCGSAVTGACCFDDGSCEQLSFEECEAMDGYSWQEDTTCEGAACPPLPGCCAFDPPRCFFSNWTSGHALVNYAIDTSWEVEIARCCPGGVYQIISHTLALNASGSLDLGVFGNPCAEIGTLRSDSGSRVDYAYSSCATPYTGRFRLTSTLSFQPHSAELTVQIGVGGDNGGEGNYPVQAYTMTRQLECDGFTESGTVIEGGALGALGGSYGTCGPTSDPPPFAGGTGRIRMTMLDFSVAIAGYKNCEIGAPPARPAGSRIIAPSKEILGADGLPLTRARTTTAVAGRCGDCGPERGMGGVRELDGDGRVVGSRVAHRRRGSLVGPRGLCVGERGLCVGRRGLSGLRRVWA